MESDGYSKRYRTDSFACGQPPDPSGLDEHAHARAAFSELAKMVGVKQTIDLPSGTYTRNQPLVSGVLPDDLLEVLGADEPAPAL